MMVLLIMLNLRKAGLGMNAVSYSLALHSEITISSGSYCTRMNIKYLITILMYFIGIVYAFSHIT